MPKRKRKKKVKTKENVSLNNAHEILLENISLSIDICRYIASYERCYRKKIKEQKVPEYLWYDIAPKDEDGVDINIDLNNDYYER